MERAGILLTSGEQERIVGQCCSDWPTTEMSGFDKRALMKRYTAAAPFPEQSAYRDRSSGSVLILNLPATAALYARSGSGRRRILIEAVTNEEPPQCKQDRINNASIALCSNRLAPLRHADDVLNRHETQGNDVTAKKIFAGRSRTTPTQNFESLDLGHCAMKPPSTGIGRPVTYDA